MARHRNLLSTIYTETIQSDVQTNGPTTHPVELLLDGNSEMQVRMCSKSVI